MQTRFEAQQMNCNTLQAIDRVGDRIIDYLAADKAQALRDENPGSAAGGFSAGSEQLLGQPAPSVSRSGLSGSEPLCRLWVL